MEKLIVLGLFTISALSSCGPSKPAPTNALGLPKDTKVIVVTTRAGIEQEARTYDSVEALQEDLKGLKGVKISVTIEQE